MHHDLPAQTLVAQCGPRHEAARINEEADMKPVPQRPHSCQQCSDIEAARAGWGVTTRYCIIRFVPVAPLCALLTCLTAFPWLR